MSDARIVFQALNLGIPFWLPADCKSREIQGEEREEVPMKRCSSKSGCGDVGLCLLQWSVQLGELPCTVVAGRKRSNTHSAAVSVQKQTKRERVEWAGTGGETGIPSPGSLSNSFQNWCSCFWKREKHTRGDLRNQSVVVENSARAELEKLPISVRASNEWARYARGKASCQDKSLPALHAMA